MAEKFTSNEYTDIHWVFAECGGNARASVRLYSERFPNRRLPCHTTFAAVDRRLRETGSFTCPKRNSGRQRFVRTAELEENILDIIEENPSTSTRKIALQLGGISNKVVLQTLTEQLLYPYHLQRVQEILPTDTIARVMYSQWIIDQYVNDPLFCSRILFTDEASFNRDGVLNYRNSHQWKDENPKAVRDGKFQRKFTINVWAGIVGDCLIGPVELPARLGGLQYLEFLREVLPQLLEDVPLNIRRIMWYMHDGAPPHFSLPVRQFLNENFPNRWIGRGNDAPREWPPRSPDHNPLDFHFWGHMKAKVYATPVDTREDLWQRIVDSANEIRQTPDIFQRIRASVVRRAISCINVNGNHFENILN